MDHARKEDDSLVGYSIQAIKAATETIQLDLVRQEQGTDVPACTAIRRSLAEDTLDDASYDRTQQQQ